MREVKPIHCIVLSLLCVFIGERTAISQETGSSYFGLSAGTVFVSPNQIGDHDLDFDPGFIVAGNLGYIFGSVRTEGEVSYLKSKFQFGGGDGDFTSLRGTVGLYIDLLGFESSTILPYVGGGLGFSALEFDDQIDDEDLALTAHGEFGVSFATAATVDIFVLYRFEYFDTDIGGVEDDIYAHQIRAGVRVF